MLVSIEQINESVDRFESGIVSDKVKLPELPPEEIKIIDNKTEAAGPIISVADNLEKRKEMLESVSPEPVDFAYERAIGNNDSVYSNFCELILRAKQKVCRIVVKKGSFNAGYATGFMVSERLMLTNWHVFQSIEKVGDSEIEFFYEYDIFGRPNRPTIFRLTPEDFFYSFKELDYCVVAVSPVDVSGNNQLASIGYHYLDPSLGKLGEEGIELLNIIHHPGGDYQQLSIRENTFTKITPTTIWYETDTAQGSSGSPVFNDQWQIVALHHMGVPSKSPDGKHYLDKDGKIVEPVNNKIDASKVHWIANEGIRISVLLKDLFNKFPNDELIAGIKKKPSDLNLLTRLKALDSPPPPPPVPEQTKDQENKNMENNNTNNVYISFPASLIETNGNISININNKSRQPDFVPEKMLKVGGGEDQLEDLLEIKKIELENSLDYSDCRGYDENFLGIKIPIPKPRQGLLKYVAKLKNSDKSILDYHYFSVIQHSVRKMPIISAINVNGNPKLRKDETEREDVWLRDRRLDYEMQLNDKFYASSGFDKGHMSRREDANWGATPELAKKFADLTCVYTNACPQVPKLNRSTSSGLWGKLEKLILEKGVIKEKGKFSKITVFNGPIFSKEDRFYKGIQIPMEFWKVILWFDQGGNLKATGFKLSQEKLVADIDFEKLGFDSNAEFKEYRCSIKSLEALTRLDFSSILKYDTFETMDEEESLQINSESDFESFIAETFSE